MLLTVYTASDSNPLVSRTSYRIYVEVCAEGLLLYKNQCWAKCPLRTYAGKKKCLLCGFGCEVCIDTGCLQCAEGMTVKDGKCVPGLTCPKYYGADGKCRDTCDEGTYPEAKNCQNCSENCKTCVNSENCTSCLFEMMNQDGKCQPGCKDTYEYDMTSGTCVKGKLAGCLRYAWRTSIC